MLADIAAGDARATSKEVCLFGGLLRLCVAYALATDAVAGSTRGVGDLDRRGAPPPAASAALDAAAPPAAAVAPASGAAGAAATGSVADPQTTWLGCQPQSSYASAQVSLPQAGGRRGAARAAAGRSRALAQMVLCPNRRAWRSRTWSRWLQRPSTTGGWCATRLRASRSTSGGPSEYVPCAALQRVVGLGPQAPADCVAVLPRWRWSGDRRWVLGFLYQGVEPCWPQTVGECWLSDLDHHRSFGCGQARL